MASSRRRLPPVSESTSCLVGRPDTLRPQKPLTIKQTSTSLPNITKSCTSRSRRPNALFQPVKVVARRYKSAVLNWLAINRRKHKRGKQPWPASWPMSRSHDKIRYVHFVQPLPFSLRRSGQGKKKPRTDVMPCLRHRALKLESKGLNPFIRVGGGFRQGYVVDPGEQAAETEEVSVGDTGKQNQSVDGTEVDVDDTLGEGCVGSKQSKWKKKQWGRNKAGERELVAFEGTDLSGVQEVDDERQLGRVTMEREDIESSSADDSDVQLSQGGSVVNVDSDVSDQGRRLLGGRHKRMQQSHQEDRNGVMYEAAKSRRRKSSIADVGQHGSGGESSGDVKAGCGRRKKRGKNRLASRGRTHRGDQYRDVDVEDDDDRGEEKRGSPKRRRRKTKHGEKGSTQPSHPHASGEEASDLDDRVDNCSDAEKSPSVDDDNSVQTSRKPSSVSVATEDGYDGGGVGGLKVRTGGREKQRRLLLAGVPVNDISSENSAHNNEQTEHAAGSQPHRTDRTKKEDRSSSGNVRKRNICSVSSSNRSDSDQANAGQISVSDSEPSVFSRDASGQLQPMDGHRRMGYLASRKRSKGTSKSSVSQPSGEGIAHAESVGEVEPTDLLSDSVPDMTRNVSQNRLPEHAQHDSDPGGHPELESSMPPSVPAKAPSPDNAQLTVTAATPAVVPNAADNFLEPVCNSRKSEMKRRRSFQKVQEERGLTVEQDSTDSDGGDVLQERKNERKRRLSKKHNVPDTLKVDTSDQQPNGQKSARDTPYTPHSARRESQPGRESRVSQDSQRRPSHEETPAMLETGQAKSARSGLSARQRRVGIDYSSHLGIRSTVLDTVPSSEDIRSSPPQSSVISSDNSAVHIRTAEYLEGLTSKPLSTMCVHPLQMDAAVGVPFAPSVDLMVDRRQPVAGVRNSAVRAPIGRAPNSDEADVDDDDDDDDDTMPCESQSSASGGRRYQRSMPSTTVSQLARKRAPQVEDISGCEPAEEEAGYSPPHYCKDIDSDSGGRSTSATPSVFGAETEDMKSSIIASHMGRRISGSVSTVVSQRGLKKRQTRGSRQRSLMGSESTAPAQLLKGSADIVVGPPPPRVRTPHPTKESGETDESVEAFDKESRSPSSCTAFSDKESGLPTPADGGKASSMSSADRHESSDSSSQLDVTTRKLVKVPSYASRNKLLSSNVERETGSLKTLLLSSTAVTSVSGPAGQNGVVGLNVGDVTVAGMHVSTESFRRRMPNRYRSSSLSGSNNELSSEGGNSGSDEDERSDTGGVALQASEGTTEQGDGDVPDAEPLPRKPWEILNRRGAQQRSRVQIQIRADEVLQRAQADSEDCKQRKRNGPAVDFLAHYHLVDRSKLRTYARAFAAEDEDEDGIISFQQLVMALETVPSTSNMSRSQLDYVFKVLTLEDARISFRMFAVAVALCERISAVANEVKDILDGLDMIAVEKKLEYYMRLFLGSDDDENDDKQKDVYCSSVKTSLLRIELKAGGLSRQMEDHVIRRCDPLGKGKVMFLDYVAYIPLFILMHERICDNPLSREPLGPTDQREGSSRSESPVNGIHFQRLESTSLPHLTFRRGSGSSVASSYFGSSLLLKQARHLLARQASLAQSRTQIGQTQSVTSLVPDRGRTVQGSQLPPIPGADTTKSDSQTSSSVMAALLSTKKQEAKKSLPSSRTSSLVGHGRDMVRSNRNRPGSSSSDSSLASSALRHGKKTSNSSLRSGLRRGGREETAAERIRRITGHVTCESPESAMASSGGDCDSRPSSASVQSSKPPSRVMIRQAEETAAEELSVVVNDATDAVPSSERETIGPLTHPPLGRLIVPGLPAAVRRLRTRSPDEMSPSPFTSSSGRTSPSNSVFSSIQASLIQGTIK